MGEAKRRKKLDSSYGKYQNRIDIKDGTCVTFYKFNSEIYSLDANQQMGISPAKQSSRYKFDGKCVIDAAISDLSQNIFDDGKWVYVGKLFKWVSMPISTTELLAIARFDELVADLITLDTPMRPVTEIYY